MKKIVTSCVLVLFMLSCASHHQIMTSEEFALIEIGTSEQDLVKQAGKPIRIIKKNGKEEYEYIERFYMGDQMIKARHYYFTVEKGKIIDKRSETTQPPSYKLDSIDLQTSQI